MVESTSFPPEVDKLVICNLWPRQFFGEEMLFCEVTFGKIYVFSKGC